MALGREPSSTVGWARGTSTPRASAEPGAGSHSRGDRPDVRAWERAHADETQAPERRAAPGRGIILGVAIGLAMWAIIFGVAWRLLRG